MENGFTPSNAENFNEAGTTLMPANEAEYSLEADKALISGLNSRNISFCSMVANTLEEKANLYNAMNNPSDRLADHINEIINVKDIFVEVVELESETTGNKEKAPRIVLIDDAGLSHACVSFGIYNALRKLISIYGQPTWNTPIPLKVRQINKNNRSLLTLDVYIENTGKAKK